MKIRLIILFILFVPAISSAGAWVNKQGESTLINEVYVWHYNEFADSNGVVTDQPDFLKYEYKPYYEYGLSDNYSAGFSPSFQRVTGEYFGAFDSGIDRNEGFAGVDVFLKRKIIESQQHGYAIAIIPTVELPGIYKEEVTPSLGKQEAFWSLMTAFGVNTYSIEGNYGYINFETGVRSRFSESFTDNSGASYKANLTISLPTTRTHSLNLGVDYTKSVAGYSTGPASFLNRYGYDSTQLGITDVYKFGRFQVEFGYLFQVDAKNSGLGDGVKISIMNRF